MLILTITPPGATAPIKIFDFKYTGGVQYTFYTEDTTGVKSTSAQSAVVTGGAGIWTTVFGSADLAGTSVWGGFVTAGYTNVVGFSAAPLTFGSGWTFDSSLKIYICSTVTGANAGTCIVNNLDIWHTFINSGTKNLFWWGLNPILIGNYRFHAQTGTVVSDAARKMGPGYLGSSTEITVDTTTSPAYSTTENGIIFTATNQYVRLPVFIPSPANPMSTASVSLNFWINLPVLLPELSSDIPLIL